MPKQHQFTIGYVSHQTGLSTHVIRAWERRYEAVEPRRTSSGRRLYSQLDIQRLELLKSLLDHGHRISTIAGLAGDQLAALIAKGGAGERKGGSAPASRNDAVSGSVEELIGRCLKAIGRLDSDRLYRQLQEGQLHHSRLTILEQAIAPLMHRLGRNWAEGTLRIVHGQMAAGVVQTLLNGMLTPCLGDTCGQPRMLVATPAGQFCYLGALAAAVVAQDHGWHPVMLGHNLPAEEIAAAVAALDPQLLALSITCRVDDEFTANELKRLFDLVGDRCRIVVGGQASQHYQRIVKASGGYHCASAKQMVQALMVPI